MANFLTLVIQLANNSWILDGLESRFKSVEDVDPVIIDQDGKRTSWGK
jgi:hypothetical protein